MNGFDTGHKDHRGKPFKIGSTVQWTDRDGLGEIILHDGCMIGVQSWEGFVLANQLNEKQYRVFDDISL